MKFMIELAHGKDMTSSFLKLQSLFKSLWLMKINRRKHHPLPGMNAVGKAQEQPSGSAIRTIINFFRNIQSIVISVTGGVHS